MNGLILIVAGEVSEWASELLGCARRAGYATLSFDDLENALAYRSQTPVQAVFLDPHLLGYRASEALRAYRAGSPDTVVIVVSREPADALLKVALEGGASAFLSWPATEETLERLLRASSRWRSRARASARSAGAEPVGVARSSGNAA